MSDTIDAIRRDGRTKRADRTRAAIIEAARKMMRAGDFRPTIRAVAAASGCSVRTIFEHYNDVDGMTRAALDRDTMDAVAALAIASPASTADCIAHAAVFGRPVPLNDATEAKRKALAGAAV